MRRLAALAMVAAALALGGCDKIFSPGRSPFQGIDVTGGDMGGELRLTDHHGKARSAADFRGKAVVVIFGYTHCPDVCPTALAEVAAAMKQLGERATQVQVLFVTLDPKRDTPQLLGQYVPAFHPDFLGLTGDDAALDKVKKDFRVYSSIQQGRTPETYTVDHSAQIYVLDRDGRVRLLFPPGSPAALMASDLAIVLNS